MAAACPKNCVFGAVVQVRGYHDLLLVLTEAHDQVGLG
jgi:hypothetical protein